MLTQLTTKKGGLGKLSAASPEAVAGSASDRGQATTERAVTKPLVPEAAPAAEPAPLPIKEEAAEPIAETIAEEAEPEKDDDQAATEENK